MGRGSVCRTLKASRFFAGNLGARRSSAQSAWGGRSVIHDPARDTADELGRVELSALLAHGHANEVGRAAKALRKGWPPVALTTVWAYSIAMNRDAGNLADVQWVAQCARRLREQWPHADPTSLHETADELWHDEALRVLTPVDAAIRRLRRGLPRLHQTRSGAPP